MVGALVLAWGWSVLHLAEALSRPAQIVLALGVAVAIARWFGAHPLGFARLARRTLPWLAAACALLAVGVHVVEAAAERSARAALPVAREGAPNVLLIVLDTVRARSLSLHGYHRPTSPRLEQIAEKSVVFDRAIATAPWTLPSHGTMFTGRYPYELTTDWEAALDGANRTLAEALSGQGYATGGFVGNLRYCSREYGLGRGFSRYRDYQVNANTIAVSSAVGYNMVRATFRLASKVRNGAPQVSAWFLEWLESVEEDRPFFAFLNYFDAHGPYLAPGAWSGKFGPTGKALNRALWRQWSPEDLVILTDAYDSCVAYLDDQVGELLDELDRRGVMDDTLVIIVGDHGEHLGEHGLADHGNSLYRPVLHVPLLVSFPGRVPGGQRVTETVTLRDLPATVCDLVGVSDGGFPGSSWARHWRGGSEHGETGSPVLAQLTSGLRTPEWFPVTKGDMTAVIADGIHYIRNGDGTEELYDFERDPVEQANMIDTQAGALVAERLRVLVGGRR